MPRELVEALFVGVGSTGPPEILLDRWPENLAPEIELPPGSRRVGSLVFTDSTLNVAVSPGAPHSVRAQYEERLVTGGWRKGEEQGLKPAPGVGLFCRDDGAYLLLFVEPRDEGSSYVKLQQEAATGLSPCGG